MESELDLIVIAYNDMKQAGETFVDLQQIQKKGSNGVITAATLVKDYDGKTSTEASLDVAHKKGTRYGALAGGLLALTYIGGEIAQSNLGLPAAAIQVFQGMLLFFLLALDLLTNYRLRLRVRKVA